MTSISKKMYINKLVDIVNKYNTAYRNTVTMKPVDVKSSTCIDFDKTNNKHGPKFKLIDYKLLIMLEHQNITIFW